MAYNKTVWQSGDTVTAVKMNNLESGVEAVAQAVDAIQPGISEESAQELINQAVAPKLDSVTYEADKVTFALKSELPDTSVFALKADTYTKSEIDGKLVGAMTYKGSVETESELPQDAQVGDMYDVKESGQNFAWNGESWDALGGDVDLSGLLTKDEASTTYATKAEIPTAFDIVTSEEFTSVVDQFAKKDEVPSTLDILTSSEFTSIVDQLETKEHATATYQVKGDYQPAGDYAVFQKFSAGADPAERKTIQLANADSISGIDSKGTGYNLIMLSKWDKVDIGSTGVIMNLNSKDGIVQLNDDKVLATVDQIPSVEGFATTTEVEEKLAGYQVKGDYAPAGDYALKSEIPSVEGLVSADQLDTKLADYTTTEVVEAEFASYDKTIKGDIEAGYTSKEQFAEAGVHFLGSFSTSMQAEQKASEDGIYDNQAYSVLVYTVGEDQNGQIVNNVQTGKTVQFLYWQGKRYTRTITNDGEKVVGSWASDDGYVALPRKGVMPDLFTLTTEADSDTVKSAMTATDTNEPITLDDLNKCLQTGYTLRFYSMQSGSVFVGFSGQAFTLTYIGFANPSQDPAIMSVAVNVTAEGQYSVVRDGTRGIALTNTSLPNDKTIVALDERIEALEDVAVTTAELPIALKTFTNKVHEKAEILGWFGVEDEAGLKSIIASKRPIFVRYGITLSTQPRYYKFPAEYVAFESNTQVKLVFEGLDTSDDSVVRYTILMNLDGTLIGEQSNISMVLEPLGADVSNLATKEEVQAKAEVEHTHELADVTDINKLVNPTFLTYSDPSETVQYLPKLEQSYVDELLKSSAEQGLVTINGQPWDAETNNWTIGAPYVIFGHFNESLTFEANLWSADSEHLGVVFNQVKSMIGTFYTEYQSKVKSIEERLTALESK